MKQPFILLILLLSFITSSAQITNVKYGVWSDNTTWSSNSIPEYGDTIVLNFNVIVDMNAYCKSLNVNSHDVIVNSGVHLTIIGEDKGSIPQLSTGLLAYYPFNGNAGDESGNGYDLTVAGPLITANRFGEIQKAYQFNGTSDYLIIPKILKADSLRELTISVWVKTEVLDNCSILSFLTQGSCSSFLGFANNSVDNYYGTRHGMATQVIPTSCTRSIISNPINNPLNQWNHIVLVQRYLRESYGSSYLYTEYYNGTKKFAGSGFNPPPVAASFSSGGIIGGNNTSGVFENSFNFFKGTIDDIRIYNRALSDNEVLQLYNLQE